MNDLKCKTWEKIAVDFNTKFNSSKTAQQLKDKWENNKKKAKKLACDQRKEIYRTGGGVSEAEPLTTNDDKVLEVIADQIKPIENSFDSDRLADKRVCAEVIDEVIVVQSPPEKKKIKLASEKEELLEMRKIEHELNMEEKRLKMTLLNLQIELSKLKIEEMKAKRALSRPLDLSNYEIGELNSFGFK